MGLRSKWPPSARICSPISACIRNEPRRSQRSASGPSKRARRKSAPWHWQKHDCPAGATRCAAPASAPGPQDYVAPGVSAWPASDHLIQFTMRRDTGYGSQPTPLPGGFSRSIGHQPFMPRSARRCVGSIEVVEIMQMIGPQTRTAPPSPMASANKCLPDSAGEIYRVPASMGVQIGCGVGMRRARNAGAGRWSGRGRYT